MDELFDFQDISRSEATIRKTWGEFRSALANKEFTYDDTHKALSHTFLRVFDDTHSHMQDELKKPFSFLKSKVLVRGTKIRSDETPDYNRMIPVAEYIKDDNRFSPPGIEWLYLAVGDNRLDALLCSKTECRVEKNDRFASCVFEIDNSTECLFLMDLTVSDDSTYEENNKRLELAGQKYKNKAVRRSLQIGIPIPINLEEKKKMEAEIGKWVFNTYMKLLSEQIFLPLDSTDDKSLMYAPFQCLAKYFISKGYSGIIYKSTVCQKGKNVVLFDKRYANPVGKIFIEETIV